MSYTTFETSNQDGKPVALYEFHYGNTYWRYCTADEDQTVNSVVWEAKAITDEGVKQGGSDENDLQITMASDLPVPALFRQGYQTGKVWLTVRRWHVGDPDSETPIQWTGTVINGSDADEARVTLFCRSISGTYDRNGLRLAWDRSCTHPLYGPGCFVDKSLHAYARTVASLTATNFTCTTHAEPAEGSFSGGFAEWIRSDGSFDRRGIESQNGNDFRVLGFTTGLEIGTDVTIYPGCAHNCANCKLFNNLPNYGGFPHMPGKSPFDGSPVF